MRRQKLLPGLGGSANFLAASPVGPHPVFDRPNEGGGDMASMGFHANGGGVSQIPASNTQEPAQALVAAAAATANARGLAAQAQQDVITQNNQGGYSFQGRQGDQVTGNMVQRLMASGFNVNCLRTNLVLRRDEWILFDSTVLEVTRARMNGVADLLSRGLRTPIPNALGHTRIEWQRVGDFTGAEISMSGISVAENDRLEFDLVGMPLPIIHKDFNLNIRHLAASRNGGTPIDTMQITIATRVVVERIEQILFLGTTALGTNNTIYGYTTTPTRVTGSVTASWVTATGDQIIGDILEMIGLAVGQNMYGPYGIYLSNDAMVMLSRDFKAESDRTILERIMAIPNITFIKPTPWLTGTQVVMVQLSREVVDMLDGIQPTVVEWESHGGMVLHYKVMAIMVPRMRTDQTSQKGIIHYS